jgi:amino acid transporter
LEDNKGLKKTLGFWTLYTIGVGAVVGDGVFTFTGYGVAEAGPSLIVVYALVGLLQMFLMLSFGELVQWHPSSGGPEVWVRKLVSPRWGAVSSLLFSAGWLFTGGTTGLALGVYTHNFFLHFGMPLSPASLWVAVFAVGWISVFALLNILGVDIAAKVQLIMVFFLITIVVAYEVIASAYIDPANYVPFMPNGFQGVIRGFPIATYAFMGASTVIFASEEARKPVDVARVLLWSSLTFIVMYTWALIAAVGTLEQSEIQKFYESIYVSSAQKVIGPIFANIINIAAWLAAATCALMGTIYQPSRDLYNLAKSGYKVPKMLGYIHPEYRTPSKNIIIVWAIVVLLIVIGSIAGQTMVFQLAGYYVVWTWCVSWMFTLKASFNFRKYHKAESEALPWRVPLWPLTPILGIVGILVCVVATFIDLYMGYGVKIMVIWGVVAILLVPAFYLFTKHYSPDNIFDNETQFGNV